MTNEQLLLILYWQISAAVLMGIDYFLPVQAKDFLDSSARSYIKIVQANVDSGISDTIKFIAGQKWKIFAATVLLVTSYLAFHTLKFIGPTISSTLFFILLVAVYSSVGILMLLSIFIPAFTTLGIASVSRVFLTFLNKSPKGPFAAAGMLCLFVSFALRYVYLV